MHNVQWGGEPKFEGQNEFVYTDGKFPSDWYTCKQVVLPYAAVGDTTLGYAPYETENRFGNHIGQIDIGMENRSI